ncbi:glycosyltransferase [Photobacterium sp. WH77]|uniref:PssE/Cps14G family polysaccharide biosynthesis glycosyltransferase n=1 Tax=unclassified Photobacterium TaxID=2628852 RepID=UPI001EDA7FED|nr:MULTISPECIES: PssE/Cps14G family polysaccharide biosynthesis glycosyltransferase [unclassified Photobacterium]MCG2835707.1 glycosyltransferase [Photobacterium sp. WH77]MCG2843320.1 glycosyltransferase [Photobacterium sp. WH80]
MNILVTVGTTKFESLVEFVHKFASQHGEHSYIFQIADGTYRPEGFAFFEFTNDILGKYEWADVVITHAGAGSTYQLLELGKVIILVPNLERVDKHQLDLANYMSDQNFALVVHGLDELNDVFTNFSSINLKPYSKENFFLQKEIAHYIKGLYDL